MAVAVSEGKTNSEIARDLFMGVATVKTHVGSLFTKLRRDQPRAGGPVRARRGGLSRRTALESWSVPGQNGGEGLARHAPVGAATSSS